MPFGHRENFSIVPGSKKRCAVAPVDFAIIVFLPMFGQLVNSYIDGFVGYSSTAHQNKWIHYNNFANEIQVSSSETFMIGRKV